jgi:hypothetical protein
MSIPPGILPLESDFTIAVNFPGAEISYTNGAHSLANGNLLSAPEHNKPKLNTPKQPVSGTLNGTVAGGIRFSEAKVRSRVRAALDVLSILKQEVIRLLYGLDAQDQADQGPRTHAEVAEILSAALSAPQRWVIARERGIQPEQVRISAEEVKLLETQALRDVRPNRMRSSDAAPDPLSNPFFTGKFGASNN